jgi:gamma-butyrobetaine dioxygenase
MTDAVPITRLWSRPDALGIEWADGSTGEFASLWLLDNRRENRDPHSGQRLIDVADLPASPRIRAARAAGGSIEIDWETAPDRSSFESGWLHRHAAGRRADQQPVPRLWLEAARLDAARDFAWMSYADARRDRAARAAWLRRVLEDGIAFMSGVPSVDAAITDASALVGRIAETNYGLVYDVRSVPQPENLAYSDLGLGLHTDNPYREPVPGFQVLHALVSSPDGGDSLFGDGFALAQQLLKTAPAAFERLARTPVPFHYRSKDADLYAERPLIQLTCDGRLRAVHYNNRSIAPLRLGADDASAFYDAYRRFAALLRDPRFQLQLRLRDADLVVFDNQRILHGRTAFSSARHARHLRGCYLTRDSVYSEAALLLREGIAR